MPLVPFGDTNPEIREGVFLAPNATLIGQVSIGQDVTIMFGAVVRGDRDAITVGDGSNLQDNVVVHGDPGFPTHIGSGVSVGHGAIVHGATVGDNTLIGMGATLLNGVTVGEGCLIAAGSVVLEGTNIPAGSLVAGVPGKIRREITLLEREAIVDNALTYRALGRDYLAQS
jgi:carbonic anhydrase/acetyltransferase-like protein (isoleucine patch superfamily)